MRTKELLFMVALLTKFCMLLSLSVIVDTEEEEDDDDDGDDAGEDEYDDDYDGDDVDSIAVCLQKILNIVCRLVR